MRSIRGLVLLASIGQINCGGKPTKFFVNNNEKLTITIPCSADGADQIAQSSLELIHWFKTKIGNHGIEAESMEKILEARVDPADENNFNKYPDMFSTDVTTGALTFLKGTNDDGTIGMGDQGLFECRMTLKSEDNDIAIDQATVVGVVTLPPPDERDPIIIDRQPTQSSTGVENVFNQEFTGNLATCQAGHASPEPGVKWMVESRNGEISFIESTSGLLSANPLLVDDDETDQFHAAELALSLYKPGQETDISPYHEAKFTCIVTYDVANEEGKLEKKEFSADFGQIKVKRKLTIKTMAELM
jgi:hypothetical protein